MRDVTILAGVWLAFAAHLVIGVVAWRDRSYVALIAFLNLAMAICVLAYWAQRWYGYLFRGITWYATDQLIPLYAVLVALLAGLTLSGRYPATVPNWLVLTFDGVVLLGAALFFSYFRFGRLL